MYCIIVLTVKQRKETAMKLQEVLSHHGHLIKTRLGLHETVKEEHEGLIVLHVASGPEADILLNELNKITDINAKIVKID